MNVESFKRPYRYSRQWVKTTWRGVRGDLEAAHLLQHPDRTALRALRNRHHGQVGFLVGNGPSVRCEDLDRLQGLVTFCCNRFYLAYERTRLRPAYLCCADLYMMRDFGQEMVTFGESQTVMMSVLKPQLDGSFLWIEIDAESGFVFGRNCLRPIHPGGATLVAALQFGYWMGIKRFILYGVDHSFQKEISGDQIVGREGHSVFLNSDGNHFIPNYRSGKPWCAPIRDLTEHAYRECSASLSREGGWLINATRTTELPDIERVPFEEALALAQGAGQ